jgi:hypothetical protein
LSKHVCMILGSFVIAIAAYAVGAHGASPVHAQSTEHARRSPGATVPKSYGRIVAAISDSIGTGLVFEDAQGVIRFVSVTGMKEGELARYVGTPTHGGIPKSYGHLVAAVANNGSTGLIFEDTEGTIRFVTITGVVESELTRN